MALDDEQKKCGGITLFGFAVITVSVAMIVIGAINIHFENSSLHDPESVSSTCSIEPRIPYYLLVAGCLSIILLVLRLIFQRCCRKCGEFGDTNKCCIAINHLCKFSCLTLYDLVALILTTLWLIVGTVWTMRVWDSVKYDSNCPGYVYIFSVVCIVLGWISVAFALVCGVLCRFFKCFFDLICCKPCKKAEENQAA